MKKLKTILQSKYLYISLLVISCLYCYLVTCFIKYESKYTNETLFQGIITDYKIDGNKLSISFKDKEKLIGNYYFSSEKEKNYFINNIKYGSSVKIEGVLNNPNNNTILNTFNYKKYLYNKRIYKTISISSITICNDNISFFYKIKNYINDRINNLNNNEYIKAFILGDKSQINFDDYNNFKFLGVSHLFAISGMHITLISSVLLYLFTKLKKGKNMSIIFSIILLFIYGLLCSFPASIRRAYTLYLLLSLNKILKFNIKNLYLLILTFVINIFIDSFIIFDIGFLYSMSTTFGLILFSKYLNKGNYIFKLFKVSLIAFIFSMPITINNNYQINILTPFNNIVIVPLVSLIIYPISIITLALPFFNSILNFFINILLWINDILRMINIFNVTIPKLNICYIIIYYLLIILALLKNKKILVFIIPLLIFTKIMNSFDSNLYVYFLDVRQGDSIVLINKNKENVTVIDTGGNVSFEKEKWKQSNSNYKISDNIILFLHSIGVDKIKNLVLTHGDFDHMGEAINLVNNFKVEKVIFNCGEYNDLEKELIKVLDKKKIKYYSCIEELNIDKNKLYFLQTKEYDNENDNSNVIYTELNGYKFMFMGDASISTEHEILNKYNLSDIDVLKVGHHGSKTSSSKEFINEINPRYSVISVGKNNRYGHPNKEVLDNLDNSKIYRTDENGSIMFKIKNNKLQVETCSP